MKEAVDNTHLLDRLNLTPGSRARGESDEERGERFYGWLPGVQDRADNVEFRTRKYPWLIMEYLWLNPPLLFEPGKITLHYVTGHKVEILGRNLRPLCEQLRRHRLVWVREADAEEEARERDLFVDEIRVTGPEVGL